MKRNPVASFRAAYTVAVFALLLSGCAARGPWRIVREPDQSILVPPGVRNAAAVHAFRLCAGERVTRQQLEAARPGEFEARLAALETSGCIPAGNAAALERRTLESEPVSFKALRQLTQPAISVTGYFDLRPGTSLRAVTPVFREHAETDTAVQITSVTGAGNHLDVSGTLSPGVIGFETAWYSVADCAIVPRSAEVTTDGKTTPATAPRDPLFHFAPGACLFRLYVLTRRSEADHNVFVIAARTLAELEAASRQLTGGRGCDNIGADRCRAIPRLAAVNGFVRITVNGVAKDLEPGSTVGDVIRNQPVPASLTVRRRYKKWVRSVTSPEPGALLALPLAGGEVISW